MSELIDIHFVVQFAPKGEDDNWCVCSADKYDTLRRAGEEMDRLAPHPGFNYRIVKRITTEQVVTQA